MVGGVKTFREGLAGLTETTQPGIATVVPAEAGKADVDDLRKRLARHERPWPESRAVMG